MQFLPSSGRIDTAIWMHYLDANKTTAEKSRRQLHKNAAYITYELVPASPAVSYMSGPSNLDSFRDGRQVAV